MTTPTARRSNRLYRDPVDKKIGGVASGVARYFDIDTTLMRAIWAASILVGGFGLFLYLILWFILDEDSNPSGSSQFAPQTALTNDEIDADTEAAERVDEVEDSSPSSS